MSLVERLRRDRGLNQEECAKAAGVSRTAIQKAEKFKPLRMSTYSKLAEFFDVKVRDFLLDRARNCEAS